MAPLVLGEVCRVEAVLATTREAPVKLLNLTRLS